MLTTAVIPFFKNTKYLFSCDKTNLSHAPKFITISRIGPLISAIKLYRFVQIHYRRPSLPRDNNSVHTQTYRRLRTRMAGLWISPYNLFLFCSGIVI